jgi:hypothetical protein
MSVTPAPQPIQLPLVWVNLDETAIQMASIFQVQVQGPEEIIVNIGQTAPPMLAGTPEEQAAQISAIPFVQCRTLVRLGITTERARQFVEVLTQILAVHDQQFGTRKTDDHDS